MRAPFAILLAGLALPLAACGPRTEGVLVPIQAQAPGTHVVEMLVATTRAPEKREPGVMFNGERGKGLTFADLAISIPPDGARAIGEVQWPAGDTPDPRREFATLRADTIDKNLAIAKFAQRIRRTPHRSVLLFVHGYNTRFEEAVYRFAQIVHDSRAPALPVLFTWPSRGTTLAYPYDRESSTFSRDALEATLAALAANPEVREIDILAHSMGNWVTLEALRQMAIRNGRLNPKIRQIMLAAPDVDVDVFAKQMEAIQGPRPPIVMFVSRKDEALKISRRFWGDVPRIGSVNPESRPWAERLKDEGVTAIDLTDVKSSDGLNHGTFAAAPGVVRAIGLRLATGQALTDGGETLGDKIGAVAAGAATTAGSGVGLVVSAPLAPFDARARRNFSERVDQFGDHIGDNADTVTNLAPK